ncbi:MAG: FecR domain-containing protein [Odoribacter sp.]
MEREIEEIVADVLSGKELSAEERPIFERWYDEEKHRKDFYELQRLQAAIRVDHEKFQINMNKAWRMINQKVRPTFRLQRVLKYAAVVLLVLGGGLSYFLWQKSASVVPVVASEQVCPGKKQAMLTLSGGKTIRLTDSVTGAIINEEGVMIRHTEKNVLTYDPSLNTGHLVYNTVTVPRGGEYVLSLADGTSVWLNSDTRITYPVSFNGNLREVSLEGEAYFKVKGDPSHPFIVHTKQFDIRVTGTEFNIRTYSDDTKSATLVEGKIQLECQDKVHTLSPGEQASLTDGEVLIQEADLEEVLAWQHEVFDFKQCRLEELLNELARWYDIQIFYQNTEVKEYHFSAWFHRSSSIEEVIDILEKTKKIKMNLKGKTLTVQTK